MSNGPVTYNSVIREAHFVPSHFDDPQAFVEIIRWEVKGGSRIRAGTLLGNIFWSDGTFEELKSPQGCSGEIAATNRRIRYERLHRPPAQIAFRLR